MLNCRIHKHNPLLKNQTFVHLLQWWYKLSKDWLGHTKMEKGEKLRKLCPESYNSGCICMSEVLHNSHNHCCLWLDVILFLLMILRMVVTLIKALWLKTLSRIPSNLFFTIAQECKKYISNDVWLDCNKRELNSPGSL